MKLRAYEAADAARWDAFVARSYNGTFLHSRRFLAYHKERFVDVSLLFESADGDLLGVFPAAVDPDDQSRVVSHPGLTYGGLVLDSRLRGAALVEAFEALGQHYRDAGFSALRYKAVPHFYHRSPAQGDLYALFRLGWRRYRSDLLATLDLANRGRRAHGRQPGIKKALAAGVQVVEGSGYLAAFWEVLSDNLAERHGVRPVHSLPEITELAARFPESISCVAGLLNGEVAGGAVLFECAPVLHAQYIAASANGRHACVIDAIVEHCIERAVARRLRWFDFGSSTEREGKQLNDGLHEFKSSFGAGSTTQDFYELGLGVHHAGHARGLPRHSASGDS